MALGFVSSAAILTFEVLPMNNLVINITMTSVSKTSLLLSSSLSTVMTKTMAQVKSPYDIVALYGIGDSHNIAVRLGLCSIADIYYDNNGRRNTAERNNKTNNKIIPSLADISKSISDNKSSSIFLTIADANSNREISPKNLGISRKQYYSRISAMMETG
jgi:hypothetical protein